MNTRRCTGALALAAALVATPAHATLTVDAVGTGSLTPEGLVSSLLSGTSGIAVSNVQFIGKNVQAGTFTAGISAGLSFDSGIVLSSGSIHALPLVAPDVGADTTLLGAGDVLLSTLPHAQTRDAAVLKFDFVPNGNKIQFNYVFGSSEYNDWVTSQYNDAFGAFVNGVNVALIPGTISPLMISTINCGASDGVAPGSGPNCTQFIDNRYGSGAVGRNFGINLGGFTQTFSINAAVNPNVTNTMYLVIGDTVDATQDSAVFLAGGTLSAVPEPGALHFFGVAGVLGLVGWRRHCARQGTMNA